MPNDRICFYGREGKVSHHEDIVSDDDAEAMRRLARRVDTEPAKLWQQDRLVFRDEPSMDLNPDFRVGNGQSVSSPTA